MLTLRRVWGDRGIARASCFAAVLGLCWLSASNAAYAQSGWLLQYTGPLTPPGGAPPAEPPCNGSYCQFWQELDRNLITARIVVAGGHLYQLQANGAMYQYPEASCTSQCARWWAIDDQNIPTKAIFNVDSVLHRLRQDGVLERRVGSSWEMVAYDEEGGPVVTVAHGGGTTAVVQATRLSLRRGQEHFEYPYVYWDYDHVFKGPNPIAVTGSSGWVYELYAPYESAPKDPPFFINEYSIIPALDPPYWKFKLRQVYPPQADVVTIAAGSDSLLTLHNDGSIWRYRNNQWNKLDNNPATASIVASGDDLYQLHNDGSLWHFTGTVCNTLCPGWELLIAGGVGRIAVDGQRVYALTQAHPPGRPLLWFPERFRPYPLPYVCPECLY